METANVNPLPTPAEENPTILDKELKGEEFEIMPNDILTVTI
jgi:hypothetical protein